MQRVLPAVARSSSGAFRSSTALAGIFYLACALLLIFAPGRLEAQIGVFHNASASGTSGATIPSFTVSGLPAGDSYFIVGVSCFATLNSSAPYCSGSSPITWGGSSSFTWTLIGGSTTSNFRAVDMWQLRNPTGTGTIVVSAGTTHVVVGMVLVGGVATSSPFGTFVQTHGTSNAPAAPAATTVVGDLVVSAAGAYQTLCGSGGPPPTGCTPGSTPPQTNQWELYSSTSSSNIAGLGSTAVATGTSTTMSWSASASNDWAIGAVPLHALAATPGRRGQTIVGQAEPIRGTVVPVAAVN